MRKSDRLNASHLRRTRHLFGAAPADHTADVLGRAGGVRRYKVSSVGQMTLPAAVRDRWSLKKGGGVEVADLGFAVVVFPTDGAAELGDEWFSALTLAGQAQELLNTPIHPASGRREAMP